jgi:peptidoglycan/xylan/chitin deacetylase (PgdA/CDA1 family)
MMRTAGRFIIQFFIASTLVFLLAFSVLTPNASSITFHRNFSLIHSDHPLVERALRKMSRDDQSPYLTAIRIQSERLNSQILRNPCLILRVHRELVEERKQQEEILHPSRFVDPNKPMVAITFDDGPRPTTEKVYVALKKHDVVATFFVIGMYVSGKADLLQRLVEEGNEIGNHSWSHLNLRDIPYEEVVSQVVRTDAAIERAVGIKPNFVRPPMGHYDNKMRIAIGNRQIAMWSIDTLDWSHKNWDKTMEAIVGNVCDGDIILIHDLVESTADNIEELIVYLKDQGYQMVTMSELVRYRNIDQKVVRYARP